MGKQSLRNTHVVENRPRNTHTAARDSSFLKNMLSGCISSELLLSIIRAKCETNRVTATRHFLPSLHSAEGGESSDTCGLKRKLDVFSLSLSLSLSLSSSPWTTCDYTVTCWAMQNIRMIQCNRREKRGPGAGVQDGKWSDSGEDF